MSFYTFSNGNIETNERKSSGIQNVFYEGRASFWDKEEQVYEKPKPTDADSGLSDEIKDIKQTRHYPFVSFRRQWQGWADRTTFHGVNIIFNKNAWVLRRIFWLGIFIYMMYALCSGCLTQLNRYLAYKTLTQETIFLEGKIQFPSVTICNYNQINNATLNDERDRYILRNLFLHRANASTFADYPGPEYTRNFSIRKLFMENAMAVEDMFKSCFFNRKYLQNCSEILQGRMVETSFCHTVNPDSLNQSFVTTAIGSSYGLMIVLWANQDKYFISESSSAGFKIRPIHLELCYFAYFFTSYFFIFKINLSKIVIVLVHERGEEPNIEQALAVGPGFSHYLSIRKHEHYFKKAPVKAFGDKECLDTTADTFRNPLKYTKKYSYNACHQECWNDHVYAICGCIGGSDIGHQRECNPFELVECYGDAYVNFKANHCRCAKPCHVTSYVTKLSSAYFPNTNYFKQLYGDDIMNVTELHDIEKTREDALLLKVFFDSKLVTKHVQVLEFNREDLYSSLGGYLGLFVGASLVTLLEFVEHVFISFIQCCVPTR